MSDRACFPSFELARTQSFIHYNSFIHQIFNNVHYMLGIISGTWDTIVSYILVREMASKLKQIS